MRRRRSDGRLARSARSGLLGMGQLGVGLLCVGLLGVGLLGMGALGCGGGVESGSGLYGTGTSSGETSSCVCDPGQVETRPCNESSPRLPQGCPQVTRTCEASCQWGAWDGECPCAAMQRVRAEPDPEPLEGSSQGEPTEEVEPLE